MLRGADIQAMIAQWRETFYRLAHPTKLGSTTFLIQRLLDAAPKMHPLWRSCRIPRNGSAEYKMIQGITDDFKRIRGTANA